MIAAANHSGSTVNTIVLYVTLIIMVILRQRTRAHPASATLVKGERLRPIAITLMDPILSLVFIGVVLFDLATRDVAHAGAAIGGALVGAPIGLARARVQFVRAVPDAYAVVFRRSGAEYVLLGLLLVLRLAESSVENIHTSSVTCVLAALMALAVCESITRTVAITRHYVRDGGTLRLGGASLGGPPAATEPPTT